MNDWTKPLPEIGISPLPLPHTIAEAQAWNPLFWLSEIEKEMLLAIWRHPKMNIHWEKDFTLEKHHFSRAERDKHFFRYQVPLPRVGFRLIQK